jgi:hypothetical protein
MGWVQLGFVNVNSTHDVTMGAAVRNHVGNGPGEEDVATAVIGVV